MNETEGVSLNEDLLLVRRVYQKCQEYMVRALVGCAAPIEFVGALVANESGGNQDASHFEGWVYRQMLDVAAGRRDAFGSIGRPQLQAYVREAVAGGSSPTETFPVAITMERAVRELATSWGFTQIMGYDVIGRGIKTSGLLDPATHFHIAAQLLTGFAHRFELKLESDFEALFRCWNTGRPDGITYNPRYVALGMRRMALYRQVAEHSHAARPDAEDSI